MAFPNYAEHSPIPEPELPADFKEYTDAVDAAPDFTAVLRALGAFQKGPTWPTLTDEQTNRIRRTTWETVVVSDYPTPDHTANISAFRLWVEACDDPEALEAALAALEYAPDFSQRSEAMKENVRGAVRARVKVLES